LVIFVFQEEDQKEDVSSSSFKEKSRLYLLLKLCAHMNSSCVFVSVKDGSNLVVPFRDLDITSDTTFAMLLPEVLELEGVAIESLDTRTVSVTMAAKPGIAAFRQTISNHGASVVSRLAAGAGSNIAYYVESTSQKPKPSPEEEEATRKEKGRRSMEKLMARGVGETALPEKHDHSKKLQPEHLWFNMVVVFLEGRDLLFPRSELSKPDGPGYRLVLELSRLLNLLDGHHSKLKKNSCSLPNFELFDMTLRSESAKMPPASLSTERLKSHVNDVSRALSRRGSWAKTQKWAPVVR
jgi:hypothetical protein